MTTMEVEKRASSLKGIGGVHPDIEDLPVSILDGLGDHEGDLDMAGKAAAEVYENWTDPAWRNAFILALGQHIENQVTYHRAELQALINSSQQSLNNHARRAVVKAYVHDVLNETVSKTDKYVHGYRRADGTRVSGYDREQAASMAAAMLMGRRSGSDGQQAKYVIRDRQGKVRTEVPNAGAGPKLNRAKGERVMRIDNIGPENPLYAAGNDTFNIATVLGANAAQAGSAGALAQEMSRQGRIGYGYHDGNNNWFRRLESASETLHHASNGRRTQTAAAMGKYVGRHGPEVSRVLGPHMRRFRYKYQGTTAQGSEWTSTARAGLQSDNKGKKEPVSGLERKLTLSLARPRSDGGLEAIPTEAQSQIMLKTGSTAPSHGYVIDNKGVVRQQAQGFGDDHYVPFNLRDLAALNHGSYVRSRAYGGPTTEDIALAMKTGTQSFETISRNGIYRVEFTPRTDKTGRKIGAWAKDTAGDANGAMVNRYGRLLDAIKAGKIQDPENNTSSQLNGRGYQIALQSLQKQFPYYIKKVEFTPASQVRELDALHASEATTDSGYVKPYHLKPHEAVQGYYDTNLGGHRHFDEIDAYRLGKARYWAAQAANPEEYRAQARREQDGNDRRIYGRGVPVRRDPATSPVPTPGSQTLWPALGGTDYGDAERSTPATQNNSDIWTSDQTNRFLNRVRALLDVLPIDPNDAQLGSLHAQLKDRDDESRAANYDEFVEMVKRNTGNIRTDIWDDVHALEQRGLHGTGLQLFNDLKNDRSLDPPDTADAGPQTKETMDDLRNDSDYQRYRRWRALFHPQGQLEQWKRTGREKLGPEKQRQFDELQKERELWLTDDRSFSGHNFGSRYDRMVLPSEDYDGLSEVEWMENRIADAEGRPHLHQPPDPDLVPPTPEAASDAVTEDDSPQEADRKSTHYMDRILRGMDERDVHG